jgi:hypothetical protein
MYLCVNGSSSFEAALSIFETNQELLFLLLGSPHHLQLFVLIFVHSCLVADLSREMHLPYVDSNRYNQQKAQ